MGESRKKALGVTSPSNQSPLCSRDDTIDER
jgi:hypothetical protein